MERKSDRVSCKSWGGSSTSWRVWRSGSKGDQFYVKSDGIGTAFNSKVFFRSSCVCFVPHVTGSRGRKDPGEYEESALDRFLRTNKNAPGNGSTNKGCRIFGSGRIGIGDDVTVVEVLHNDVWTGRSTHQKRNRYRRRRRRAERVTHR